MHHLALWMRRAVGAAAVAIACSSADAGVIRVGSGPYIDIQSAVDAAKSGDTILVYPGTYQGFVVDDKSLSIVTYQTAAPIEVQGTITIRNLGVDRVVVLGGENMTVTSPNAQALIVQSSLGSVRIVRGAFNGGCMGSGKGVEAVRIAHGFDVALRDVQIVGGAGCGGSALGGDGVVVDVGNVAFHASSITGGDGGTEINDLGVDGGPGGNALRVGPGVAYLAGCTIVGGAGGTGSDGIGDCSSGGTPAGDGGDGGHGLVLVGSTATVHVLSGSRLGGAFGTMGTGATGCGETDGVAGSADQISGGGAIDDLAGQHRTVDFVVPAKEHSTLALTCSGLDGDRVFVMISAGADWKLNLPFQGVSLIQTPAIFRLKLGTIGATGTLDAVLAITDLGPAVEAMTWHAQFLVLDAGGSRQLATGSPMVVLDAKY